MLIRLLSINIWDLPVPLPGFARRRRRRRLLEHLPRADADLVLIQEAFLPSFKPRLAAALVRYHADHYLNHRRRPFGLPMDGSGGLATFSRFPLAGSRYVPFRCWRRMRPEERLGRKGALWTEIETSGGRILVGNVHLYAGGGAGNGRARSMQTQHLLQQLRRLPKLPTIVAGDFNMALEHEHTNDGPTGFELMGEAGFTEIAGGASPGIVTVSPRRNRFARYTPWAKPERRLTQVFFRGDGFHVAEPPRVCLDDPPVSDHFGLVVTLETGG